jgi:signal peptidase I
LPYLDVHRGDIIVFRYPLDLSQTYVKRVIGVPGDRVRIVNKAVSLNGKVIDEPYAVHKEDYIRQYGDNFPVPASGPGLRPRAAEMLENHVSGGELIVPEGSYFAMGDNRDRSDDSRYWGFVPRENIIGKPLIVYWSYNASTPELSSGISAAHLKDLMFNFFSKTRWARTFHLIDPYELER